MTKHDTEIRRYLAWRKKVKGKRKNFQGIKGKRKDIKKAIVTLHEGDSIDVSTGL